MQTTKLQRCIIEGIKSTHSKGLRVKLRTHSHAAAQYVSSVYAQGSNTLMDQTPRGCMWVCVLYSVRVWGNMCMCVLAGTKWVLPPLAHIRDYNKAFCLLPRGITHHNDIRERHPRVFGVY